MKLSINKVILLGEIGSQPELKTTKNDKQYCQFRLKTWREWSGKQFDTWHNVELFGFSATLCANEAQVGTKVYLEGMVENSSYEKDGVKKFYSKIVANSLTIVDPGDGPQPLINDIEVPF